MQDRIGPYQILNELAQGGMGAVYRARDGQLGRDVALKLLRTDRPMDARSLERFRREVLTLARLRHPNVVRVHTAGVHQGAPFFVQDLVEGQALDKILGSARRSAGDPAPLPVDEAARITRKLASALQCAHEAGILHRDVKPANVILTSSGEPVLIDFGIAKNAALALSKTGLTKTGQGVGSPGYWSPEQACGELKDVGPRSDVYSLGATLYALLVGHPPFEGEGIAGNLMLTINEVPTAPRELRSEVPPGLEAICLRCLEKDPVDRYATARELEQDLLRYEQGAPPLALGGPSPRFRALALRLRLVVLALVLPLTLALLLLTLPPSFEVRAPVAEAVVRGDTPLRVAVLPSGLLPVRAVEVNGILAELQADGMYTATLDLPREGEHRLTVAALGLLRSTQVEVRVRVDNTAPVMSLIAPLDYHVEGSEGGRVVLRGQTDDASATWVSVAGILEASASQSTSNGENSVLVAPGEAFVLKALLKDGLNTLNVSCVDAAGNRGAPVRVHVARPPRDHDSEALLRPYRIKSKPNTYLVTQTLRVSKRQRLVLPAGATLRFSSTAGLICRGELWALGTENARVRFLPDRNRWEGISLEGDGALARLSWSLVSDAYRDPVGSILLPSRRPKSLGGGISVRGSAHLVLSDSVLLRCIAEGSEGGGVLLRGGPRAPSRATMSRVRFESCRARRGGGVYCGPNTQAWVTDCVFVANSATLRGGGLAAEGDHQQLVLAGVSFSQNKADRSGGGAFLDCDARLTSCQFKGNSARTGGGLATRARLGRSTNLLSDVTFEENEVVELGGGAVLGRSARLEGCSFVGNRAPSGTAGALALHGPSRFLLNRVTFSNNLAVQAGGLHGAGVAIELDGCAFLRNTSSAKKGGGLVVDGGSLSCRGTVFQGNRATYAGGALCSGDSEIAFAGCLFRDNKAEDRGGAIVFEPSLVVSSIRGTGFAQNHATKGGAIWSMGRSLRVVRSRFEANEGFELAGAIGTEGAPSEGELRITLVECGFSENLSKQGADLFLSLGSILDVKPGVENPKGPKIARE